MNDDFDPTELDRIFQETDADKAHSLIQLKKTLLARLDVLMCTADFSTAVGLLLSEVSQIVLAAGDKLPALVILSPWAPQDQPGIMVLAPGQKLTADVLLHVLRHVVAVASGLSNKLGPGPVSQETDANEEKTGQEKVRENSVGRRRAGPRDGG